MNRREVLLEGALPPIQSFGNDKTEPAVLRRSLVVFRLGSVAVPLFASPLWGVGFKKKTSQLVFFCIASQSLPTAPFRGPHLSQYKINVFWQWIPVPLALAIFSHF